MPDFDISDLAYWTQREAEERERAADPRCPVAAVHTNFADRYAGRIAEEMRGARKEA